MTSWLKKCQEILVKNTGFRFVWSQADYRPEPKTPRMSWEFLTERVNIRIASWGKWRMKQSPFRLDFLYFSETPLSIHTLRFDFMWHPADGYLVPQWTSHRRLQQPIVSQTTSSHGNHHLNPSSRLLGYLGKIEAFQHVTFQPQFPANSQVNLRKSCFNFPPIFRYNIIIIEQPQVDKGGQMIPTGFPLHRPLP